MKKLIYIAIAVISLVGCTKDTAKRNSFLGEARFSYTINTNLPAYNSLKTPGSTVFIPAPSAGIKGVFVTYLGGNTYRAWEAACPNHNLTDCQAMHCAEGSKDVGFQPCEDNSHNYTMAMCPCDKTVYHLLNGQPIATGNITNIYPLLNYNVTLAGEQITISN